MFCFFFLLLLWLLRSIVCIEYFKEFDPGPFDYHQLIKRKRCQAGDREMPWWWSAVLCLTATDSFWSANLPSTVCTYRLNMHHFSILNGFIYVIWNTSSSQIGFFLQLVFSSWLNGPYYFASPSLLDCWRPMRGRSAGLQASAAENKKVLTSASERHIREKWGVQRREWKKAYWFIFAEKMTMAVLFIFLFFSFFFTISLPHSSVSLMAF